MGVAGVYREVSEGLLYTDSIGRESIYPSSLIFIRKTGKKYIEIGMEKEGRETFHYIKSIDSGKIIKMSKDAFVNFKKLKL